MLSCQGNEQATRDDYWSPKVLHKVAIEILAVGGLSILVEEPIYLLLIT